jgi:ribonuclease BN (tRNA processing enzyme)
MFLMQITFCGTGAPSFNPQRACAGIIVHHDDAGFMLDCGPGTVQTAIAAGVRLDQLRAVFLSHLHFDHTFCVAELLTRLAFWGFALPVIYGPCGTRNYVDRALDFACMALENFSGGRLLGKLKALHVQEIPPGDTRMVAGVHVQSEVVPHATDVQAQARRLTVDALSVVYSGDTRAVPEIMVPLAQDADVLIHECYTTVGLEALLATRSPGRAAWAREHFTRGHSLLPDVARIAHAAGVRTLVLTHLLPTETADQLLAEAKEIFDGTVIVPHDGLLLKV